MKNKNKALLLVLSVALVVVASVFTTLAYFTSTDEVTNTFTVGNVELGGDDPDTEVKENQQGLDEADVNEYGQLLDNQGEVVNLDDDGEVPEGTTLADRVDKNDYKLIPGHTYTKDPTVHVNKASEPCWIFVKVENGIAGIESTEKDYKSIAAQITTTNGWSALFGVDNVYYQEWAYDATEDNTDLVVFETFTIDGNASAETLKSYAGKTINVTVYAIQKDGFDTVEKAWEAGNKKASEGGWIKDDTADTGSDGSGEGTGSDDGNQG